MAEVPQTPTDILLGGMQEKATAAPVEELAPEPEVSQDYEDSPSIAEPEAKPDDDKGPAEEQDKPMTLKALAEKLEMPVKDLYSVELGDGMTIGQLKDRMKDLTQADDVLATAEDRRQQVENELMQRRRELAVAAQNLGREPTEAERQQATRAWHDYVEHETTQVMNVIPEWKDPAIAEPERTAVVGLLKDYGLSDTEIANTVDHRQIKLINDFARLRSKVRAAAEQQRIGQKRAPQRSNRSGQDTSKRVSEAVKGGRMKPLDAATALLIDGLRK